MKKLCQKGSRKSFLGVHNGDLALPRSTYSLVFDDLVRCQKIMILGRLPDKPKDRTNRALERQGVVKGTSTIQQGCRSAFLGSQDHLKVGPFDH